jgi:transporter family protein
MWFWLAFASSVLLGLYDVAKKQALRKNDIWFVLFGATVLTVLFLCPFLGKGTPGQHLRLALKAVLVTTSWVSGMIALKLLPITVVSPLKATRPLFVILFSIVLFGERMNPWQWAGTAVMLAAIWLLSVSGQKEGIRFFRNKGIWAMGVSILSGVASALYDKHIMSNLGMEPLFVQSWANFYIAVILGIIILVRLAAGKEDVSFRWDWTIVLIAVLITAADACYFFALGQEGSLLSVISMVRRCSVVVTFVIGAVLFKERNLRGKAVSLLLMLAGMFLLFSGTV